MVLHSTPRTLVPVVMIVVVTLLLSASCPGLCDSPGDYDDDYDEEGGCHPEEADHCFADVNENLLCNLGKPNGARNCTNRDVRDLCDAMGDALDCSEDIMATCSDDEGYFTFEKWNSGLMGVYRHLCFDDRNRELLNVLLKGSKCFRLKRFLTCVEERANLTHIADLLTTDLDLHECNKLQVEVGACIEDGEKNRRQCQGTSKAAYEALTAFFTWTACGQLPTEPPPPPLPCSPTTMPGPRDDDDDDDDNNDNNNNSNNTNTTTNTTNTSNEDNTKKNTTTTTINTITVSTPRDTTTTTTFTSTTTKTSKTSPQIACRKDLNTSGTPTASTVVVTVLVTLVLVGLAAMVLLKKGVLVIRTDLDRRLIGLNEDDGNSAYDRF